MALLCPRNSFKSWIWHTKLSATCHLLVPSPNLNMLQKSFPLMFPCYWSCCHRLFSFSRPRNGIAVVIHSGTLACPLCLSYPGESSHPIFITSWEQLCSPSHFTLGATLSHTLLFTVLWTRHCSYHTAGWRFSTFSSSTSVTLLRRTLPWRIHFCSLWASYKPRASLGFTPKLLIVGLCTVHCQNQGQEAEWWLQAWGETAMGSYCLNGYRVFVLQEEKSYRDGDGGNRTTLWTYLIPLNYAFHD